MNDENFLNFKEFVIKTGLTQAEIARVLNTSPVSISRRVKNINSEPTFSEIKKVEAALEKNIFTTCDCSNRTDKVEIKYYKNSNLKTDIKTSAITSVWFDRELVENIWQMIPENLRITTMLGDKMDSGSYPMRKNDILIMDISDTDITKAGVYAFTTHNDTYMFINGVNRRFDGTWRFYFYNKNYPEKILTDAEVEKAGIKIIGRIVKNLSLTI